MAQRQISLAVLQSYVHRDSSCSIDKYHILVGHIIKCSISELQQISCINFKFKEVLTMEGIKMVVSQDGFL